MIVGVRRRLRGPQQQHPSDREIYHSILDHTKDFYSTLSNTGVIWDEYELTVTVSAGQSDYQLNDTRMGKPYVVFTMDDSDPAHIERTIPIFEMPDLNYQWDLPNDIGSSLIDWNGHHSAWRVGHYRRNGFPYLRFKPIPQETAQYRVMYVIGNWADSAGLGDEPVMPEHHHLIEVRAAISQLPFCEWNADEDFNTRRQNKLALALKNDEMQFARTFELYNRSLHGTGMNERWIPEI